MSETPHNEAHDAGVEAGGHCQSCTQMFELSMGMYSRALLAGDYQVGLHWLRQAGNLTAGDTESARLRRDGYARLVIAAASKGVELALHSGNITKTHKELAETIDRASGSVLAVFRETEDELSIGIASMVHGFAGQLSNRLNRYFVTDKLVTPPDQLDGMLGCFFEIIAHAARLDRHPEEALPSRCDRLALATTAVSNADCYLSWFFPSRFSDWERAEIMCRRTSEWLRQCDTLPCKVDPDFDDCDSCEVVERLNAAAETLGKRRYKLSKRALRAAEEALADVSCV